VEARVVAALDHPTTCPHGNPIPGYVPNARSYLVDRGALRLRDTAPGRAVEILCVSEVVEDEEELISYLNDRGLTPGTPLTLVGTGPDPGTIELRMGHQSLIVPERVAYALWVVPLAPQPE
jgi:DtxR family Mn-dependent transcriptional regulator